MSGFDDPTFWMAMDQKKAMGEWVAYAKKLETENANLKDALAVEKAHAAGCRAQAVVLRDIVVKVGDPTGILAETKEVFTGGTRKGQKKTKLANVYDTEFDKVASEHGIKNPAERRS